RREAEIGVGGAWNFFFDVGHSVGFGENWFGVVNNHYCRSRMVAGKVAEQFVDSTFVDLAHGSSHRGTQNDGGEFDHRTKVGSYTGPRPCLRNSSTNLAMPRRSSGPR